MQMRYNYRRIGETDLIPARTTSPPRQSPFPSVCCACPLHCACSFVPPSIAIATHQLIIPCAIHFPFVFIHSVFLTIAPAIPSTPTYRLPFVSLPASADAISPSTQPPLRGQRRTLCGSGVLGYLLFLISGNCTIPVLAYVFSSAFALVLCSFTRTFSFAHQSPFVAWLFHSGISYILPLSSRPIRTQRSHKQVLQSRFSTS